MFWFKPRLSAASCHFVVELVFRDSYTVELGLAGWGLRWGIYRSEREREREWSEAEARLLELGKDTPEIFLDT